MKEFKDISVKKKECGKNFSILEKLLAEKSAEGWDVVCVCPDISSNIAGEIIITLQRDK